MLCRSPLLLTPALWLTPALLLALGPSAGATPLDPNVTEAAFATAPNALTGFAWAPDGSNRLFTIHKSGVVRIVQLNPPPAAATVVATPFATLAPVFTNSECGLIGMAFDPGFATNGYVYFFVTVSNAEQQIQRYRAVGNVGMDRAVIVPGLPTRGANHDGGSLGFGPDGKIYWGIGDNGSGVGVNADLTNLGSKIGRANRDGSVPVDNPFIDGNGPNNEYIFARGFRNPFTLTFQPTTGALWVNVVGSSYEQIFVVGSGDHAGYNAYENNQPAGFITPVIKYRTGATETFTITTGGAVRSNNVVTFTTTARHGLRQGERVTIAGVSDASFNGDFFVASADNAPATTTFTVAQVGADATGDGGTVTTISQGRAVSGGVFYDATHFPTAYRGNFFYGDYIDDRVMRATVGPGTTVTSVDDYATAIPAALDTSIGPDGALYYAGYGGQLIRVSYNNPAQGVVVSAQRLWTNEGEGVAFSVRLNAQPAGVVTVNTALTAGPASAAEVSAGAALTFDQNDWETSKPVLLGALQDVDTANDVVTFTADAGGIGAETVQLTITDDDQAALVVSTATLTLDEGTIGTFTVALSAAPPAPVTVSVARTSGDPDITVTAGSTLTFDSTNYASPQQVTISAAADADATDDTAIVSVSATGYVTRDVSVRAVEVAPLAPTFTSTPSLTAVIDAPYRYDANATGSPAPTYSIDVPIPAGMSIDASTGVLDWTPTATGAFAVQIRASNGVPPDATQAFTITVGLDQPPSCVVAQPVANSTVSGATASFYANATDDVGVIRAAFYVDNTLAWTEPGPAVRFDYGGAPLMWDTTQLADGPHQLRIDVTDTSSQTGTCQAAVIVDNSVIDAGVIDTGAAGNDAAGPLDGGVAGADSAAGADTAGNAGVPSGEVSGGCGCRAAADPGPGHAWVLVVGLLLLARRRRR
ncbi:MAG: PQQ-dependent sugar dehydrogenase [Deltaproteobacteria bacterium]|nr:PQQ-dependent sugar dehydrogenase [Deltaproteobacteria bacterium]